MVVGNPLSGQQYLFMEHPSLLFRLLNDQMILHGWNVEEQNHIGQGQDGSNGKDEFAAKVEDWFQY